MRSRKRDNLKLILVFLLLSVSLGYAFIKTDLTINGTSKINATNWNVYFDNVQITAGSVTLSEGDSIPTINSTTLTDITYVITLKEPGDFYEFTVDVVNDGTLDAMIGTITNKLNNVDITTLPTYMNYSVTYSDGGTIQQNHLLAASTTETYKVRIEYRTDIDPSDLPSIQQTNVFNFGISYIQADDNATSIPHVSSLYSVLEKAATVGTYARKYTGEHKDSFTSTGTEDIYYWYSDSTESTNVILDKNNVVFAGYCWKMYRTTDTGGVKMIYQGKASNNQCTTKDQSIIFGASLHFQMNFTETNMYYGTSYEYDSTNNEFRLAGNIESSPLNASTVNSLIGKYTCQSTSSTATCANLNLVASTFDSYAIVITLSSSNASRIASIPFNFTLKYSISSLGYMYNNIYEILVKNADATVYTYAQGFTYSNGTYTLNSDTVSFSGSSVSDVASLATRHYTCWNTTGTCNTISYIYDYSTNNYGTNRFFYVNITDGKNVTEALNDMLYANDVNTKDSLAKLILEKWYERNLIECDEYIEDTVFCANRSIESLGGWDPTASIVDMNMNDLVFKSPTNSDLRCNRVTDQFSTLNTLAKTNYKVGLSTSVEAYLLNDLNLADGLSLGWNMSPKKFHAHIGTMYYDGGESSVTFTNDEARIAGLNPVISLKPNTMYTAGDGSLANPYLVETS